MGANQLRDQVIAEFTDIINQRGRNESTTNLQYWKSVGVPSNGGMISENDFTQWGDWLEKTGIVTGQLRPAKYFTNDLNGVVSHSAAG